MKALLLILQLFPYVLQAIVAVEQVAAGANGATKKKLVLDSLTGVSKIGEQVPVQTVAILSGLIDSTVTAANQAGIIPHGNTQPITLDTAAR